MKLQHPGSCLNISFRLKGKVQPGGFWCSHALSHSSLSVVCLALGMILQTANAQRDGWRSPWCGHCWQTRGGPTNLIPQSGISNSCAQLAKNDAVTWIMTSLEDHRQQNSRRDFPKHPPALMVSWGFPVRISTDCLWLKGNWSWFKITSGCQQWPLQLCYPQHKLLYTSVPSLILVFLRPKYIWIQPLLRVESYKWSVCEKHSRIFKNNSLANTIPCSE